MTIENLYKNLDIGENSEIEFNSSKGGLNRKLRNYFEGKKS